MSERVVYKLMSHQQKMLDLLTENDRFILGAEMGTGKTLPVLVHLTNLIIAGEIDDFLIVAPLTAIPAWFEEAKHLSPEREQLFLDHGTVINYEKISRSGSKYQIEMNKPWGAIVCDESHKIVRPESNRTQYFVGNHRAPGIASQAKFRYLLSGTLVSNSRLEDFWAALKFLLDDDYMTYKEFRQRYLIEKPIPGGGYATMVVGYRKTQELIDMMARYTYRITKEEAIDLPDMLPDRVIKVSLSNRKGGGSVATSPKKLYEEALENYISDIEMEIPNPLSRFMKLRQIAAGHIKESDTVILDGDTERTVRGETHLLKSEKVAVALDYIESNLPNKTVVFYNFTATCDQLESALKKAGISYTTQNGAQKNRDEWLVFQNDDSIKVLLIQYESGNAGITLHSASTTIFIEPTDRSVTVEQARSRTHRKGQKSPCEYIWIITEGTVEEDMYARLVKHEDFSEKAYRDLVVARARVVKDKKKTP